MRKIREVLRLVHELGLSNRQIAASLKMSHTTVGEYRARASQADLKWPLPPEWDDARLEALLFPPPPPARAPRPHPEQGYRSCLGLMKLARTYPKDRLEAACQRSLRIQGLSYRSVKSILSSGVDQLPLQPSLPLRLPTHHPHLRGPDYYRTNGHEQGE